MATSTVRAHHGFYATPAEAREATRRTRAVRVALALVAAFALPVAMVFLFYVMVGDVLAPGQQAGEVPGKFVPLAR